MSDIHCTLTAIDGKPAISIDFPELSFYGGILNGKCRDFVAQSDCPLEQVEEMFDFYYSNMPVGKQMDYPKTISDIKAVVNFLNGTTIQ